MQRIIKNVQQQIFGSVTVYTFYLTAQDLLALGVVERFQESAGGVQRPLRPSHVVEIAEAMCDPELLWLEPIAGALEGNWEYNASRRQLKASRFTAHTHYLSIDDGQHRLEALKSELLTEAEVDPLTFEVKAYIGMSFEQRLRLFRMQTGRTSLDRNLDLAQRNTLGEWRSGVDGEAYAIVCHLAEHPKSPLVNRIQLKAGVKEQYSGRSGKPMSKIKAAGLFPAVKSALQRRSRLSTLPEPQRQTAIVAMVKAAKQVWPRHWDDADSNLTNTTGMRTLLGLFIRGVNFREEVGGNYTAANIKRALERGSAFRWGRKHTKNRTPMELADALDATIQRGIAKAAREARSK